MQPRKIIIFVILCYAVFLYCSTMGFNKKNQVRGQTKESANIRSGPGLDNEIIAKIKSGNEVIILDLKNDWYKVKLHNGKKGWIFKPLVEPINYEDIVVTSDRAPLRSGPGSKYKQFAILLKGKTFTKVDENGNWYRILLPAGRKGWISKGDAKKVSRVNVVPIVDAVVRELPDENSRQLVKVNKGTELIQLDKTKSWYLVKVGENVKGWIHESTLKMLPDKNLLVSEKTFIRRGPSKRYEVIETILPNTYLTELESKDEWIKIRTPNGNVGWVEQGAVVQATFPTQKLSDSVSSQYVVTDQDCNIRQGYSTNFKVLKRAKKGTILLKIGAKGDWFRVKFPPNGRIGWIRNDLIDDSNDILFTNQKSNIRQGYNKSFRVKRTVKAGTPLAKIESRDDWFRVYLTDGVIGWIRNGLTTELSDVSFTNQKCNVRQGPGTNWTKINELTAGTIVTKSRLEGGWYRVKQPNDKFGWIRQDLLATALEFMETNKNTNIRKGPGTDYPLLKNVPGQTALYVSDQQDDWLQVGLASGGQGWVRQDLVSPAYHNAVGVAAKTYTPSTVSYANTYDYKSISPTSLMTNKETNIRMGPGLNFAILLRVDAGTELIKLARQGEWYEVKLPDGTIGFVHNSVFSGIGKLQEKGKLYTIRSANVRRMPDSTSQRISSLAIGTAVTLIEQRDEWTYVKLRNGSKGWIFSPLLSAGITDISIDDIIIEYGTLKALTKTNIRSGPGETFKIISSVRTNEILSKIGSFNKWHKVQLKNNQTGWISDDYVDDVTIGKVITKKSTYVKELSQPNSKTIETIPVGKVLNPRERMGDWFAITTSSNRGGWVSIEDVEPLKYPPVYIKNKTSIRREPNSNASILMTLNEGDQITPIVQDGDWYFINLPDGRKGWVSKSVIFPQHYPKLRITRTANAHVKPSINSEVVSQLMKDDEYQSVLKQGEWYKIILRGGDFGWIYSAYYDEITSGTLLVKKYSNIRHGPGLEYGIIGTANEGQRLKCLTESENWCEVLTPDGKTGWLNKALSKDISFTPVIIIKQTYIRSGPGDNFARLATFNANKKITPISQQNGWYEFKYSASKKGWVKIEHCIKKSKSRVVFTLERSNIRKGPGPDYEVIDEVEPATDLMIIGESSGWYHIKFMDIDKEGWIRKELIFE